MRFAVLSHLLPPAATGQPVMLGRLLSGLPPERYCLIDLAGGGGPEARVQATRPLPARHHHLPAEWRLRGAGRIGRPALDWRWRVRQRAGALARVLKAEGAGAVVACSGDLLNLPAAVRAAAGLGVRLLAYYFDDYPMQWISPPERWFASSFEREAIASGGTFVVPNELLRDELIRRGASRVVIVRNPLPDDVAPDGIASAWPAEGGALRVLFAGAIYHAHADAFRNLLAALEGVADLRPKLRLLTAQPEEDLEALGLTGQLVERRAHVPETEIPRALREADVLFLPLAFSSPIPEVIRTSSPGKLADYLASGRPVLVHAPEGSFPVWYARRNDCAWVADTPDPGALGSALRRIAADPARRLEVTRRAVGCALRDFAPARSRRAFLESLGEV